MMMQRGNVTSPHNTKEGHLALTLVIVTQHVQEECVTGKRKRGRGPLHTEESSSSLSHSTSQGKGERENIERAAFPSACFHQRSLNKKRIPAFFPLSSLAGRSSPSSFCPLSLELAWQGEGRERC